MTALDVLKKARTRIEKPDRWCQGVSAQRSDGGLVDPNDPTACRWCAIGALAAEDHGTTAYADAVKAIQGETGDAYGAACFNDSHTHAEVLAAFSRAIAKLEGR